MSRSAQYEWRLRQEARRKEYLSRVRQSTSRYHARYQEVLDDLAGQGMDQFIITEYDDALRKLNRMKNLLGTDPEMAREISMELSTEIGVLPALARAAKADQRTEQKLRKEQLTRELAATRTNLTDHLHARIVEISDPVQRDFAFDDLKSIENEIRKGDLDPAREAEFKSELDVRLHDLLENSRHRALEWRANRREEVLADSVTEIEALLKPGLEQDRSSNPAALAEVGEDLRMMVSAIRQGETSIEDVREKIRTIAEKADDAVTDEQCRRQTVRSLVESLRKSGFVVEPPNRDAGADDVVVVHASKPSGSRAKFRVDLDGGFAYKFDHYEGKECAKDIDQVVPMLQEIYGIELSNERVMWENPDRIDRTARPLDAPSSDHSHE